jgi:alpha-galactosidase
LLNVDEQDPLSPYLDAVTRQNAIPSDWLTAQSPAGWCSWYQFFQELTAEDVRRNLFTATDLYKTIPLQIFQIDDGFETRVGDWFSFSQDFPDGVASLASEIRQMGFTPGLWLAPFILQRNSRLAREHPDWLLRGRLNQPVNAGFIWDTITTALDLTHPEAMDYACQVVNSAVSEWGFPYLKLDFLYAAALLGRRRDPTQTRAQVLRSGLKKLRQTAGEETFILGCGCPLGSALGLVQAMRIGADVDVRWHPTWKGIQFFFEHEPGLPSTRNAIQNAITRASLHRRWWLNDPDCLLLRPTTELTLVEVQSLATVIGMSDGLMFLSDDLPEVPAERLRVAQAFLPPIGISPRVMDWFDSRMPQRLRTDLHNASGSWYILALFNWEDEAKDMVVRLEEFGFPTGGDYWGREFWSNRIFSITGAALRLEKIPAHGTVLLSLRHTLLGGPVYLGSDLHYSQGQEVSELVWKPAEARLILELQRPGNASGIVDLNLPNPPQNAQLDGRPVSWVSLDDGCYRFPVEFNKQAKLNIFYRT